MDEAPSYVCGVTNLRTELDRLDHSGVLEAEWFLVGDSGGTSESTMDFVTRCLRSPR